MECKQCGHCCRGLLLEIGEHDVLREPKLLEFATLLDGHGSIEWEDDLEKEYALPTPCPFLKDNKCSIYPTRPNVCVGFKVGGGQCFNARQQAEKNSQ